MIEYEDTEYYLHAQACESDAQYREYDFIYNLYEKWFHYYTYHYEQLYYTYYLYFFHTPSTVAIVYPTNAKDIIQLLDKDFFEIYKKWYCQSKEYNLSQVISQLAYKDSMNTQIEHMSFEYVQDSRLYQS